jgi:hypothetical protein
MALSIVVPVWIGQVTSSYDQDDKCLQLLTKLSIDPQAVPDYTLSNVLLRHKGKLVILLTKLSIYPQAVPGYTLSNGLLRHKGKLVIGNSGQLRTQLLENFHQSALGRHSGERATYHRLKLVFYCPKMPSTSRNT